MTNSQSEGNVPSLICPQVSSQKQQRGFRLIYCCEFLLKFAGLYLSITIAPSIADENEIYQFSLSIYNWQDTRNIGCIKSHNLYMEYFSIFCDLMT
jgi:hypothetical protein